MKYIIEYKSFGGFYLKCDGSFLVQANDVINAERMARNVIDTSTGGAKITYISIKEYEE